MRLAIIGYGAIGKALSDRSRAIEGGPSIEAVLVRSGSIAADRIREDRLRPVETVDALLAARPDLVVECAGMEAVRETAHPIIEAGIDLVVASTSALVDDGFRASMIATSRRSGGKLIIASGAVGALDALAAMHMGGIEAVTYRGAKPPAAWAGTAAAETCNLSLGRRQIVLQGTAREAATLFPKNANVVASIGLVGIGLDRTAVELVSDPEARANRHELEASGPTGRVLFQAEGLASSNPKTSSLVAYSILETALRREAAITI